MNQPYVFGQSGTARPDPVLVTRPPAKISTRVDAATRAAKRCRTIPGYDGASRARPVTCRVRRDSRLAIRGRPGHESRITNPQSHCQDVILNVNGSSLVSLLPSVTFCVWAPSFSCHASMVYVPGGRPFSSNFPSGPVVAKYGWSRTPV